jgi:hypothetical protein
MMLAQLPVALRGLPTVFWAWEAILLLVVCYYAWLAIKRHYNKRKEEHENNNRWIADARLCADQCRGRAAQPKSELHLATPAGVSSARCADSTPDRRAA